MSFLNSQKQSVKKQYLVSITAIGITALISYLFVELIGYRTVALVLLLAVSIVAIFFSLGPVLVAALFSSIIWNYFFIPPTFTFHIGTPEDALMFLMYFVIVLINGVLTHKIREIEFREREKEEKEKAIKLYDNIFKSLSHELRTPISAIMGCIETIRNQNEYLNPNQITTLLSEIETASWRLNGQVENLLNASRLESGQIKPKIDWCDLNEVIFNVINQYKRTPLLHQLIFNEHPDFRLYKTDVGLMEQILNNLINNGIQHTPEGTTIWITLETHTDYFCISVSDNGPGFPETEIDKVFNKFYRIDQNHTGGSGLGLSIVKGYTEALNGAIKLENRPEGGAKFTLTFKAEALQDNIDNEQN